LLRLGVKDLSQVISGGLSATRVEFLWCSFRLRSFRKDIFIPHFFKVVYPYQLVHVFQVSPLAPCPNTYEPTASVSTQQPFGGFVQVNKVGPIQVAALAVMDELFIVAGQDEC
jgi:hypothetical protein